MSHQTNSESYDAATVDLRTAIEIGARIAMSERAAFAGVSGDFDDCYP
jgi:hypothetical protein